MNTSLHAHPRAAPDQLLHLALPGALEEEVLDWLRAQEDLVAGFTVLHGYGYGANVPLATVMERVEGRARRVVIQLPVHGVDLEPLLARLRASLPSPQVYYWVVPLLGWGTLA